MTGNVVYVCADENDSSCQECGRITGSIGKSAWVQIDCSIRGTIVKVAATNSMLQIAEIEIFSDGTTTPAPTSSTTATAATTSTQKATDVNSLITGHYRSRQGLEKL